MPEFGFREKTHTFVYAKSISQRGDFSTGSATDSYTVTLYMKITVFSSKYRAYWVTGIYTNQNMQLNKQRIILTEI